MTYTPKPVDCTIDANTSVLSGKTAVVTGGANGIGEAYVRALHAAKFVANTLRSEKPAF